MKALHVADHRQHITLYKTKSLFGNVKIGVTAALTALTFLTELIVVVTPVHYLYIKHVESPELKISMTSSYASFNTNHF